MWHDLWVAFALMLVIEGLLPSIHPASLRQSLLNIAALDDSTLRIGGLVSMIVGAIWLYLLVT
jgi:uncharacterized protein YjeT (DUF2065 family)